MVRESFLPADTSSSSASCRDDSENVLARLERHTALQPHATAVSSPTRNLSFFELDHESTALARRISAVGVAAGSPVALLLPSSTHFVVAALAAWKEGLPYLPIDVSAPRERSLHMIRDSGAALVVTLRDHVDTVPKGPWTIILLDEAPFLVSERDSAEAPRRVAALDDLAYLIYTSGSTGKPKGVEITHRNLLHLVNWHANAFAVKPQDRVGQIAGVAFDAAVWEVWPNLCCGASIRIPPAEVRQSSVLLRDWFVAEKITLSFAPTVLAEELIQLSWPTSTSLGVLLTGGDVLHTFPPVDLPFQLINNYGPTETTVVATSGVVPTAPSQGIAPAIGNAILHTGIRLIDEQDQPVADGDIGEIIVTGGSVGRGYRNQPKLTEERFVTIDVNGLPERAFRTGDLARRLPDGQLAFAGRADGQVKIRGFRIELDEIASHINQHPAMLSSVVIVEEVNAEKRLVAYLVKRAGEELNEADMRAFLSARLPVYMIPVHFALLDRIPVTENGKLDRDALPPPNEHNRLAQNLHDAPRNEVEQIVEGTLTSILGVERVSLDDNFFLLGGHSLMGAQVIARLRDVFGIELSLRNVFENPTVASLSAKVETLLMEKLAAMTDEEVLAQLEADADGHTLSHAVTAKN